MSKLNWEYYEENICTDRPVAALFKGKKCF